MKLEATSDFLDSPSKLFISWDSRANQNIDFPLHYALFGFSSGKVSQYKILCFLSTALNQENAYK